MPQARIHNWTITATFYGAGGTKMREHTRIRAPFVSRDGLRITIYRKGLFSKLGKILGIQDIEVGAAEFDDEFIIQGNNIRKVKALFGDPELRRLIESIPDISLTVQTCSEGIIRGRRPANTDELFAQLEGHIRDQERLKQVFELFAATLKQLHAIGSASREDPDVVYDYR